MRKYFLFGKRGVDALEDSLEDVALAIEDLEAELFEYDPEKTEPHDLLNAYSIWTDYAYLDKDQYTALKGIT